MASIQIVHSLPYGRWIQFVEESSAGNIFHTPFMMEVFRGAMNYEPFLFAAINEVNNEVVSLLAVTKVNIFSKLLSMFSSRMISYGGIIHGADENKGLSRLLEYYDHSFKNKSLFTEIRNVHSTESFKGEMIAAGYQYEDYLNYVVDLRRDASSIFRSFSESRKRNIRALEKKGVYAKEVTEIKEIEKVYKILHQTYSRIQIPLADISLFESAMKHLFNKGMVKFFLAKLKDEDLASLVALLYKGVIITWYYGSNPEFQNLSPASLLIWHVIKWGSLKGYQSLDFGGAGRPNEKYGVRDFKVRFRGSLTNYGRYIKVYSPTILNLSKIGYQIYRKIL